MNQLKTLAPLVVGYFRANTTLVYVAVNYGAMRFMCVALLRTFLIAPKTKEKDYEKI